MDTADAIALALAGLAVLIGASIAAVVVLRPPTRREHPPSTMPGHAELGDASRSERPDQPTASGAAAHGDASTTPPAGTTPNTTGPNQPSADRTSTPLIAGSTPGVAPRIPTDATGGDSAAGRDGGVSVAILADEDGNHRWRVSLSMTSDPITVDVFSFRPVGTNGEQPWRHELLASPMGLEPGHAKSIGGPVDPTVEFTVSIAWITHHPDGDTDTTRLLHIPVSEIKTWPLNNAAARSPRRSE